MDAAFDEIETASRFPALYYHEVLIVQMLQFRQQVAEGYRFFRAKCSCAENGASLADFAPIEDARMSWFNLCQQLVAIRNRKRHRIVSM